MLFPYSGWGKLQALQKKVIQFLYEREKYLMKRHHHRSSKEFLTRRGDPPTARPTQADMKR